MVRDALGREWQLGTIQVDYSLPERFDLNYINENNKPVRPVMIHRAPFGSLERFIAILIEHTAGNFPLWLTINQILIVPVGENHKKHCEKVFNLLENNEIRALIDDRSETVSKKIRTGEINKIPYIIIIGDKEIESENYPLRGHGGKDLGRKRINELLKFLKDEIESSVKSFS